jgi:hypothetical protein
MFLSDGEIHFGEDSIFFGGGLDAYLTEFQW